MQTFKKLLFLLTPSERKKAFLLLILITIMSILDTLGVASIVPFVAILTNPNLIETNSILNTMFNFLSIYGVKNDQQFIFFLGVLVFILLIVSLVFKAVVTYLQTRFIEMRQYSFGRRLVEGYLRQDYSWFLNRHSADLGKNILSEVNQVIGGGLRPGLEIIAKGLVSICLIILLIIADPIIALMVGFSLIGSYLLIFYFIRIYLNQIGEERLKNNELRFIYINEAFSATKEVKVGGLEDIYLKRFSVPAKIYAKTQAASVAIATLPRFILEAVAFGGILLIILFVMKKSDNFANVIPVISLYVYAGYRLIPAMQQIYSSFAAITFAIPAIDRLYYDIKNLKAFNQNQNQDILQIKKSINLKNIYYYYPNSLKTALKDINISIKVKTTVGLMGETGSGKTTTVDIILGLLKAQKGSLEVDGQIINKNNLRSWQKSIGYVPQHIFLSDDTVAANVALGTDHKEINQDAVEKACKIANLHKFVTEELPIQYNTRIGENGVRLSGGQRQRIGIARAFYHNPQVLILDEATSALDNKTEKEIMNEVNNLSNKVTIIIIAHRINTLKNCDQIFLLEKGELKSQGTFNELINTNENFRKNAYS